MDNELHRPPLLKIRNLLIFLRNYFESQILAIFTTNIPGLFRQIAKIV